MRASRIADVKNRELAKAADAAIEANSVLITVGECMKKGLTVPQSIRDWLNKNAEDGCCRVRSI
jgi:hypothetical protein